MPHDDEEGGMARPGHTNRLAGQTSPYLLQHAHNPVDWYPWGEEALERAKREERPILLSIGYAACHWCHVMERESFEDAETASFMNEHFVSIKVDREERPDLDAIYMDAAQAMTGQGGWPLTAFLTPEGNPFYVGTYFPPRPGHGMPSFRQVLHGIADAWRERRSEVLEQGQEVVEAIGRGGALEESVEPLDEALLGKALASLQGAFDPRWGGFGGAPKFPQPMVLEFLLRMSLRGSPEAKTMLEGTLDRMAAGGIYDQLGGGFARYSTDAAWHVPHFEKMLYDNAQLARVYGRAWQVTRNDTYRRVATETLDYLLREMQHPEGAFFSSQDADSEGIEGKFFAWTYDELVAIAGGAVAAAFGATPEGNWDGLNVLWFPAPPDDTARELGIDGDELAAELAHARVELFEARQARVHPGIDDKVLAGWNGLAISAFAEAGRAFGVPAFVDAAVRAAEFVLTHLHDDAGRLLRSWRNGVAGGPAYLDDHALMASACLTLYESTSDARWFREARALGDELLRLFRDAERGGFFQTGTDAEALVVRPKDLFDNAVPSGNSAAAKLFQRLARLTGDESFDRAASSALRVVRDPMARMPTGFAEALCAVDFEVGAVREIAIVGAPSHDDTRAMLDEVLVSRFLPNHVLAVADPSDLDSTSEIELLRDRTMTGDRATAYVCEHFVCKLPVTDPRELARQLS
jgi:uncharacterized protein YyaL (SSP411 family)